MSQTDPLAGLASAPRFGETASSDADGLDLEAIFIAEARPTWVESDEDGNVMHRTLEQAVAERAAHSTD